MPDGSNGVPISEMIPAAKLKDLTVIDTAPLLTPEKDAVMENPVALALERWCGVEAIETAETQSMKGQFADEALSYLEPLKAAGHLTADEIEEVAAKWEQALVLDETAVKRLSLFESNAYRLAVANIHNNIPPDASTEVREYAKSLMAKAQIEVTKADQAVTIDAYVDRAPAHLAEDAQFAGMPEQWVVLNWGKKDRYINDPVERKKIIYEESAHLIDKLGKYWPPGKHIWANEMMARVLRAGLLNPDAGSAQTSDLGSEAWKQIRGQDYANLYVALAGNLGDETALMRMFLGKEDPDSETAKKVIALFDNPQVDMLGELVDAGMQFPAVAKIPLEG